MELPSTPDLPGSAPAFPRTRLAFPRKPQWSAPFPEPLGDPSGPPREPLGKSSEHLRNPSGHPRETVGTSSEILGNPSDRRRTPLGNLRNIFGKSSETPQKSSCFLGNHREPPQKVIGLSPDTHPDMFVKKKRLERNSTTRERNLTNTMLAQ